MFVFIEIHKAEKLTNPVVYRYLISIAFIWLNYICSDEAIRTLEMKHFNLDLERIKLITAALTEG